MDWNMIYNVKTRQWQEGELDELGEAEQLRQQILEVCDDRDEELLNSKYCIIHKDKLYIPDTYFPEKLGVECFYEIIGHDGSSWELKGVIGVKPSEILSEEQLATLNLNP